MLNGNSGHASQNITTFCFSSSEFIIAYEVECFNLNLQHNFWSASPSTTDHSKCLRQNDVVQPPGWNPAALQWSSSGVLPDNTRTSMLIRPLHQHRITVCTEKDLSGHYNRLQPNRRLTTADLCFHLSYISHRKRGGSFFPQVDNVSLFIVIVIEERSSLTISFPYLV